MTPSSNRTLTALFDRREDALKAVEELVRVGIPRSAVRVTPEADVAGTSSTSYDTSKDEKGFWASLADFFMPEETDTHMRKQCIAAASWSVRL